MLKVVEYTCYNPDCEVKHQVVERFLDTNTESEDSQLCLYCNSPASKVMSSIKGYVKGTKTPCKC